MDLPASMARKGFMHQNRMIIDYEIPTAFTLTNKTVISNAVANK